MQMPKQARARLRRVRTHACVCVSLVVLGLILRLRLKGLVVSVLGVDDKQSYSDSLVARRPDCRIFWYLAAQRLPVPVPGPPWFALRHSSRPPQGAAPPPAPRSRIQHRDFSPSFCPGSYFSTNVKMRVKPLELYITSRACLVRAPVLLPTAVGRQNS